MKRREHAFFDIEIVYFHIIADHEDRRVYDRQR